MIVLKVAFLVIALYFTPLNYIRVKYKKDIPFSNMLIQTIGLAGFITCQWLI